MLRSVLAILCLCLLFAAVNAQPKPEEYDPLTGATRQAIVDSVAETLINFYVFPDKGKEMASLLRKNLKRGKYDEFSSLHEFTQRLTDDIRSVTHDLHLHVDPMPRAEVGFYLPDTNAAPDPELVQRQLERRQRSNFGFENVEHMPGNVGYIKLNGFSDASYAGKTAIAAMNFVGYCDALIFDLRDNGGGSPSMIQLISSYLFEDEQHLNSFYIRDDEGERMDHFYTQAYVDGNKLTDIPVYVLTSSHTFSAAEEFSYNLKHMKRAEIVGDTTGGGAHPVDGHGFPDLLVQMSVPYGRAVNPITKTNWEGVGVIPTMPCETDQALEVAHQDALKKLIANVDDERQKFELQWVIDDYEAKFHPTMLSDGELQKYTGTFGPRQIRFENGKLIYQREERQPYELIPMGNHFFRIDELDYFRLEFVPDASGRFMKVIGHYSQGNTDENSRTDS